MRCVHYAVCCDPTTLAAVGFPTQGSVQERATPLKARAKAPSWASLAAAQVLRFLLQDRPSRRQRLSTCQVCVHLPLDVAGSLVLVPVHSSHHSTLFAQEHGPTTGNGKHGTIEYGIRFQVGARQTCGVRLRYSDASLSTYYETKRTILRVRNRLHTLGVSQTACTPNSQPIYQWRYVLFARRLPTTWEYHARYPAGTEHKHGDQPMLISLIPPVEVGI